MKAGQALREARRRSGLTQRDLGRLAAVAQPLVARIESGAVRPRTDTLEKLLRACGETLETRPVRGLGVNRSLIKGLLELTPSQRLRRANEEAISLSRLLAHR